MADNYILNPRLDITLNHILQNPDRDNPAVGYSALEKKVNIRIEARDLQSPLRGIELLAEGFYEGKISLEYLQELAQREDIDLISAPARKVIKH